MSTPLAPGVYVREIPGGPRAIEGAPTAVAIFVGETERGPTDPIRINSPLDYERIYGGYLRHRTDAPSTTAASQKLFMPFAVTGYFENGGPGAYVLRALDAPGTGPVAAFRDLTNANDIDMDPVSGIPSVGAAGADVRIMASSPGVWGNFIGVSVADSSDGDAVRFSLSVYYQAPGETNAELVEEWDGLSPVPGDEKFVVDVLKRSAYVRWEQAHTLRRPGNLATPDLDNPFAFGTNGLTGGVGGDGTVGHANYDDFFPALQGVDDAALIVAASDRMIPGTNALNDTQYMQLGESFISYVDSQRRQRDLFFVGDLPRFATGDPVGDASGAARDGTSPPSDFAGIYWPHIVVADPVGKGADPAIILPPCGHIAGLYGRTDGRRGVWKAPAGVNLRVGGVRELDVNVLDTDQERLNPLGINALRRIPGAGFVIWGARTRRPATQWRYVPVRRTAMFLRKSIYNGIQWAVFEPNAEQLWASLRAAIGAFMETQFRNGAFAGTTSSEAYFVKCDAKTTTEDDQIAGVVNILVGFAPLRPAEFVIVKLSQKTISQA